MTTNLIDLCLVVLVILVGGAFGHLWWVETGHHSAHRKRKQEWREGIAAVEARLRSKLRYERSATADYFANSMLDINHIQPEIWGETWRQMMYPKVPETDVVVK